MSTAATASRALAFGVCVTATALVVRKLGGSSLRGGHANVPLRPPDWVFGIVWPIIYATTGAAWVIATDDAFFAAATLLSCTWLVAYAGLGRKRLGAAILLATAAVSVATTVRAPSTTARLLAAPLASWTVFAAYLNAAEVVGGSS